MAVRVYTAKAGKDYPDKGIKKGDTYYWWAFFRQPRQMSKTPPRRSQLEASSAMSDAFRVEEQLADQLSSETLSVDDIIEALNEASSACDDVISQFEDSISNLEQAFPGGCPNLDEANERRDAVESFKQELEDAVSEIENLPEDKTDSEAEGEEAVDSRLDQAREIAAGPSLGL